MSVDKNIYIKSSKLLLLLFFLWISANSLFSRINNLALNKPYQLYPSPDFGSFTDMLKKNSTVGWKMTKLVLIWFDLESIQPIELVSLELKAQPYELIYYPSSIVLLVSNNGKEYFEAGQITKEDWPDHPDFYYSDEVKQPTYNHKFTLRNLHTKGRYILLLITVASKENPSGSLLCSGIEILKGKHDISGVRFTSKPIAIKDLSNYYQEQLANIEADLSKVSLEIVTRCIKWAKPYYKGKIKALIICPSTSTRKIVELAQRLNLDFMTLPTLTQNKFGSNNVYNRWFSTPSEETLIFLARESLNTPLDVIIMGFNFDSIPEKLKGLILTKIKEGTGLVYINPKGLDEKLTKFSTEDKESFISVGIPFEIKTKISLSKFGNGRIVKIDYSGIPYEYSYSFLIKSIIWASKKEPDILIKSISPSKPLFSQDEFNSSFIELTLLNKRNILSQLKINFLIHDEENNIETEEKKKVILKRGNTSIQFGLPHLKKGIHYADFFIKDTGGKIVNWGSTFFKVESDIEIEEIIIDKDWYNAGEVLKGQLILSRVPENGMQLDVELVDNFNRIMKRKTFKPIDKKITFSFFLNHPLSILLKIRGILYDKNSKCIQTTSKEFSVVKRKNLDDFLCIAWGGDYDCGCSYFGSLLNDELYKYGIDAVLARGTSWSKIELGDEDKYEDCALSLARSNLYFIPYITKVNFYTRNPATLIRNPCLSAPAYRSKLKETLIKRVSAVRKYGPLVYDLGDENVLGGHYGPSNFCVSPTCLKKFQEYLKTEYGNLNALNNEWNTNFKNWDEVKPQTFKEARKSGNYPPWLDHRMYMDSIFADIHRFCRDTIQSVDPWARVGFEGALKTGSFTGYDWWRLSREMGMLGLYTRWFNRYPSQKEIVRSFAKKGTLLGMWFGSYLHHWRDEDAQRYFPWEHLFHGFNAVMIYNPCVPGGIFPAFKGDLSPFPWWNWTMEEINEIKKGIGKLILNCKRENDGIAIHYSQSSLHASTILSDLGSYLANAPNVNSQDEFCLVLEDLGLQYNFVSYQQIEKGELLKKKYKVLILPYSLSISKKEGKEIERFVRNGGLLIADYKAGIMDKHGKILKEGLLDKVFGLERGENKLSTKKVNMKFWTEATVEPEISVTTASALEKVENVPLVIVNKYGRGYAIYLNFLMDKYKEVCEFSKGNTYRQFIFGLLFRYGNIKKKVELMTPDGRKLEKCEVCFFKDRGGIEYAGFLKMSKGEEGVKINFPYKAHLYDVRKKIYFGFTDTISTDISFARAKLYALLPYEIKGLNVDMKEKYRQGDIIKYHIRLEISKGSPSTHVFRLEVYDPEGNLLRYYSKNILVASGGNYKGEIPLALNEKEGNYRLVITEIVSGKRVEKKFVVRENKKGG